MTVAILSGILFIFFVQNVGKQQPTAWGTDRVEGSRRRVELVSHFPKDAPLREEG